MALDASSHRMAPSKNADSQPSNKHLNKQTVIIIAIVFAILGFGIFGIVQNLIKDNKIASLQSQVDTYKNAYIVKIGDTDNDDDDNDGVYTREIIIEETGKNDIPDVIAMLDGIADEDDEIKTLIDKIGEYISSYYVGGNLFYTKTYDDASLYWKIPGTSITIDLDKNYGIFDNILASTHHQYLYEPIKELLENNNFVVYSDDYAVGYYYNQEKQIICNLSEGYGVINCAKTNWISEERRQLALELARASGADSFVIRHPVEIINSEIAPYQRIVVSSPNNGGRYFYRTSPDAEWQYIDSSQSAPNCDAFNDDAKKAFSGSHARCDDYTTNTQREITL